MSAPFELLYVLAHPDCARLRKYVVERGLKEQVAFRNLYYPEVQADLLARGGSEERLPALWDGTTLHQGAPACLRRLEEFEAGLKTA